MKIIGKTETGFILEAKEDELANFIGYYYAGESDAYTHLHIGTEIKVAEMYHKLRRLHADRGNLEKISDMLIGVAGMLSSTSPIVEELGATL